MDCNGFYWVIFGFTGFPGTYWVLLVFLLGFTWSHWVLLGFNRLTVNSFEFDLNLIMDCNRLLLGFTASGTS